MSAPSSTLKFSPIEAISLKNNPEITEAWVQQVIADHPQLLGLSPSIVLKDKERSQPSGGRLDILLQDEDTDVRYEVEIQLGITDETHIIRTIEYWDVERRRYPNYDHVAVIVAEEITARFFNVISLLNQSIPLIALKMTALKNPDGSVGLFFTRVLDLQNLGTDDDDAQTEQTDRSYWEKKASATVLNSVDELLSGVHAFEPKAVLSYNKFYLGLWLNGRPNNFAIFRPRRSFYYVEIKLDRTDDISRKIEESEFEEVNYTRDGRYRFRLDKKTSAAAKAFVLELMQAANQS
ncbi:hypothetical protein [uncultured Sutterella sp.]|uniref:hypothetical protein n=1 Tax=uncultured Sutterella sp. TaxID=286133 RepID=UPI0025ED1359|nr:hypothetical protein [uncultured Sutterella sp.]